MARQLRIEYPGAVYHVTSRGNQRNPIFFCDRDKSAFLDYCQDVHNKFGAIIHAYCLMDNHYHLLLETPCGNLSQVMHFINTSYTVFINTKYSRVGHLLQGRFKAIIIEADSYAQELSRYIHLNPVRAKIVLYPAEYPWSSYREYVGQRASVPWLSTALVLSYFGYELSAARTRYEAYVIDAMGQAIQNPLRKAASSLILGSEEFIARLKKTFLSDIAEQREIPAIRGLKDKIELATIQRAVEQTLKLKNKLTRNVAIYLCCKRTDYTLKDMAEYFQVGKSAIGKICKQMKENLVQNKKLERAVMKDEDRLFRQKWKV